MQTVNFVSSRKVSEKYHICFVMSNLRQSMKVFVSGLLYIAQIDCLLFEVNKTNEILVGGKPYIQKNVDSALQCVHLCFRHKICHCQSINIIPNVYNHTLQCQLLNFTHFHNNTEFINYPNAEHVYFNLDYKLTDPKKDCLEWKKHDCNDNGLYPILINNKVVNVFCDMNIHGGGWIVFQKRFDGTINFERTWKDYKNGFGDMEGEFWLGNEIVHQLSQQNTKGMEFLISAKRFNGETAERISKNFKIAAEQEFYEMSDISYESGYPDLSSSTQKWNKMYFSTPDKDNDKLNTSNCAHTFCAGWWFNNCFDMNFNGYYNASGDWQGIVWNNFSGAEQLKETHMMVR